MSFDEKEKFYKYLQLLNPNSKTGTLIIHKFNKYADIDLLNTITHQFDMNYLKKNFHEKKKRWDCMFKDSVKISLYNKLCSPHKTIVLEQYKHLNSELDYYFDITPSYDIQIWKDENNNTIFDHFILSRRAENVFLPPFGLSRPCAFSFWPFLMF